MKVCRVEEMRRMDKRATAEYGIPPEILMENAGEAVYAVIQKELGTACYGSGTRSYAGEGLVGLSWAFLRAGAHNVIGALWEVSDESTPRLMDTLYQGLEDGQAPAVALRNAKLDLIAFTEQI